MPTSAGRGLAGYLSDHFAGSAAGVQLARRLRDAHVGAALGATLSEIATEIEEDRETLRQIMEQLELTPSPVREAGARGAELFAHLKQKVPMLSAGSDAAARLEDLELLSLGIEGKRLLWTALATAFPDEGSLEGVDLQGLGSRASSQRERLERFRLRAATEAASAG